MGQLIYLDNGATTFPKPAEVHEYMCKFYREWGVNPGRASYDMSHEVEDIVQATRKGLMEFFNGDGHPERLVFGYNATDALNNVIQGSLKKGDHAICSCLDHNSVLRPLYVLSQDSGVEVDYIPFDSNGYVDPDDFKKKIKSNTKLVIMTHGSNVFGTIQPVGEVGKICREKGVTFAIDAAQTAGMIPIDMEKDNVDVVVFTGHKSLYGPTGIGGAYVRDGIDIKTTRPGGTGVKSAVRTHLDEYPFRLESGTLNIMGVAGLYAGLKYIAREGLDNIHKKEITLLKRLIDGFRDIPGVKMYFPDSLEHRASVLSINIDGFVSGDVGMFLDVDHSIAIRTGLQCAPLAHDGVGSSPKGTVRFSIGYFNSEEDIDAAITAIKEIAASKNGK